MDAVVKNDEIILKPVKSSTKITKIVLDGFKSFAKYTELLMGDEFNIILGPNGSGKSNVLDALCFVLGKSSSKSLRAEKSANLIYNGGKTKKSSKQAEVSIWLDNSKKVFPINEKEIKISRVVSLKGSSKYKINNKHCTRGEILELLSSIKVNPNGYNIILQGDIAHLVEMSPIERRQVIEEIAGIGIYEEKKQQALNELSKVENKLNEAEIILKEREGYLKDLKKDRNQALKHKSLNDRIKQNKASFCSINITKKKLSIENFNKRTVAHSEKLKTVNDSLAKARSEIEKRKEEINSINKDIENKSEKEQSSIQKQVENLRVEIATKKTKIFDSEKEKNRLLERIQHLDSNIVSLENKKKIVDEKKAELNAQKIALTKTFEDISAKIELFRKKHNIDDVVGFETELESFEKNIESKQKIIEDLRVKQQNFLREKDKLEFQLQIVEDKLKKVAEVSVAHKEELKILEQKRKEFKKITEELNVLLDSDSKSATKLGEFRKQINFIEEKLAKLQIKQATIKDCVQGNIAVKKIIENKNIFGGIHGTIADLGVVEEKFSLALEVAAANKMHSIIADTDKIAAEGINFLKEKRIGSATFLPLNKIKFAKQNNTNDFKKGHDVFGFAIDLIDFDPLFKNAFNHVFGSTLIVKNLDSARKVGVGSFRMVTLTGDLIEKSAAMTGGHRNKKTATFKNKTLESDIKNTNTELNLLQNNMNDLVIGREKNEEKIIRFRELKAVLEGEIIKTEKSLHLDTGDVLASETYKKEILDTSEQINKDVDCVENEISGIIKELTDLKIKKQEIKSKINSLRSPVILAELNAFEEKKKELAEQLMKVNGEIENLELQIKEIFDKDKDNTDKLLKEHKKDFDELNKTKISFEKLVAGLEKNLQEKEKEQMQFMTKFKSLFEKRNKLGTEISVFEDKLFKLGEISRKEEIMVNTIDIEQKKLQSELIFLESEFEQFEGIELIEKSEEQLKKEIYSFERSLTLMGNVNMRALEIYETVEKEYSSLLEKKEKLSSEKNSVMELMDEIENSKKELFLKTLEIIDKNFRTVFAKLTNHGDAFLEVANNDSMLDDGLFIKVKSKGEKFLDLRSLSGGEKTLTALAFLFAIQEHEPAPFYILDEVDAALDKENCDKLAGLIKEYCKNAQYIVISHKDNIISKGDVLYGISKNPETEISTAVSLKMS